MPKLSLTYPNDETRSVDPRMWHCDNDPSQDK